MVRPDPQRTRAYLLAVALVAIMAFVKVWTLRLVPGAGGYVIIFCPMVALSAWYGGLGPGLLATAMAAMVETYMLPPTGSWYIEDLHDRVRWLGLLFDGAIVSVMAGRLHAALAAVRREQERSWGLAEEVVEARRKDANGGLGLRRMRLRGEPGVEEAS